MNDDFKFIEDDTWCDNTNYEEATRDIVNEQIDDFICGILKYDDFYTDLPEESWEYL